MSCSAIYVYACVIVSLSQFAVLLKLRYQSQNLLWSRDDFILQIKSAVFWCLVQKVTIVHHDAAGVCVASGAGVAEPVDPPHGGAILQVEVRNWVESVTSPLLPIEVPGAETHQSGLQNTGQPLGVHPLVGANQFTEGISSLASWCWVSSLFHLLPFLLWEKVRAASLLPVLAEQALEPGREARDRRQAGELDHVREFTL